MVTFLESSKKAGELYKHVPHVSSREEVLRMCEENKYGSLRSQRSLYVEKRRQNFGYLATVAGFYCDSAHTL